MHDIDKYVREAVRPYVDKLLANPTFGRIAGGQLSKSQTAYFLWDYEQYAIEFPRLLLLVGLKADTDEVRLPIVRNLWEEHGSGDLSQAHRRLFSEMRRRLGLTNEWDVSMSSGAAYGRRMYDLLEGESLCFCLGATGPGTEAFTPDQYREISTGIASSGIATREDLVFFEVHLEDDVRHAGEMNAAIRRVALTPDLVEEVVRGAQAAIEAEGVYWDSLGESLDHMM